MKIMKMKDSSRNRAHWRRIEQTARRVSTWPTWMRGGSCRVEVLTLAEKGGSAGASSLLRAGAVAHLDVIRTALDVAGAVGDGATESRLAANDAGA